MIKAHSIAFFFFIYAYRDSINNLDFFAYISFAIIYGFRYGVNQIITEKQTLKIIFIENPYNRYTLFSIHKNKILHDIRFCNDKNNI